MAKLYTKPCTICGHPFSNPEDMEAHLRAEHANRGNAPPPPTRGAIGVPYDPLERERRELRGLRDRADRLEAEGVPTGLEWLKACLRVIFSSITPLDTPLTKAGHAQRVKDLRMRAGQLSWRIHRVDERTRKREEREEREQAYLDEGGSFSVYRFYDKQDQLLYVGQTSHGYKRMQQHNKTQPWWREVARSEVEHHESREEALQAEAWAIHKEHPKHNIVRPKPWRR